MSASITINSKIGSEIEIKGLSLDEPTINCI